MVRLLQAEAMEVLLYRCARSEHYTLLTTRHHGLLLRVIAYRRERGTHQQLSYAQGLKTVRCQSVEAFVRQRPPHFAGGVVGQSEERLPKEMMLWGWPGDPKQTLAGVP